MTNHVQNSKYSRKRQSAGSNPFRPKLAIPTLIPHCRRHHPPCSSKLCATHSHDQPQISPNWVFQLHANVIYSALCAKHALVSRLPVLLRTFPPSFVMIGQRVWELWPIISKPRPLHKDIGPWRPCFMTNLTHLQQKCAFSSPEGIYQIWC